jgi:hypothetical protein
MMATTMLITIPFSLVARRPLALADRGRASDADDVLQWGAKTV